MNELSSGIEVNWQRCFQLNALAQISTQEHLCARVRIHDEEILVTVPKDEASDPSQPDATKSAWLQQFGWRSPTVLRGALSKILMSDEIPIRFRELIAGRPGFLAKAIGFFGCNTPANTLVEWPISRTLDGEWQWPLPPHTSQQATWEEAHLGPHPWGRANGFLVELCLKPACKENHDGTFVTENQTMPSVWAIVGQDREASSLTVRDLYAELAKQMPRLGIRDHADICLSDCRRLSHSVAFVQPTWHLLRDLRWTQGEKLHISFQVTSSPQSSARMDGSSRSAFTASRYKCENATQDVVKRCILVERDAARPKRSIRKDCLSTTASLKTEKCAFPPIRKLSLNDEKCKAACTSMVTSLQHSSMTDEVPLDVAVQHSRRLLLCSSGVRQFEFHPVRNSIMLAGRKDGVISVLDYESDAQTHKLEVDSYPILGLSWLHTRPEWAVVGASQSGTICTVRYDETNPGRMEHVQLEPFLHLSSLSVNCTDDFFMTSGFCIDLGLYDLVTGRRINTFRGLHQNFINILRFAHRSPHIFATASFDHTCKIWDLRAPINADRPVALLSTETLNVICCFSPDDQHVLCSGVDSALQQFSVTSQQEPVCSRFPLPPLRSDTNYRRSLYLADGNLIATAATNESLLRIYTASAPHKHLGHIDFKGMLLKRRQSAHHTLGLGGRLGLQRGEHVVARSSELNAVEEYVQSLRCHPTDPTLLGTLLSTSDSQSESYIAMLQLSGANSTSL